MHAHTAPTPTAFLPTPAVPPLPTRHSAFLPRPNPPSRALPPLLRSPPRRPHSRPFAPATISAEAAHPGHAGHHVPRQTPYLDKVTYPQDLKGWPLKDLKALAADLRHELIHVVSQTGGHFGSSLGVVELTVALHHVFNAPADKIIWDVAHQAYPHKILTGRRAKMPTLRQEGGLSGFTKRAESEYDVFGAGHSSTSISAAHGMAVARDLAGKKHHCIAVIGDGAITGGMAYEAMNSAGYLKNRLIVILNDNGQVSLPTGTKSAGGVRPASALSDYTARLFTSKQFLDIRSTLKQLTSYLPQEVKDMAAQIDEYGRSFASGQGTLFEELGFYYVGPVNGHDMDTLVHLLENIRDMPGNKPVLVHVKTEKGYGYAPAEVAFDKMHGVSKFDVATGKQFASPSAPPSYTTIFANALIDAAEHDRKVVAITAAMPGGTGLNLFGERFPQRCFDVGIAEQHAVTFAAGMACEGYKPFCCIYSTFLQRGYDQVVHDVSIQKLPVRFILDRAGLVGNDGPTHHGTFDLAYLGCIPHMVIMAPSDELELLNMITTSLNINDAPSVIRFPRGSAYGIETLRTVFGYNIEEMPASGRALPVGRGRIVKMKTSAPAGSPSVAILSLGTRLYDSLQAAAELESRGVPCTVADARYMKPLDYDLIEKLAQTHSVLITIEEGSIGGFGDHVLHFLALEGLLDSGNVKVRPMVIPDRYIEHATQKHQYDEAGLSAKHITSTALRALGKPEIRYSTDLKPHVELKQKVSG